MTPLTPERASEILLTNIGPADCGVIAIHLQRIAARERHM